MHTQDGPAEAMTKAFRPLVGTTRAFLRWRPPPGRRIVISNINSSVSLNKATNKTHRSSYTQAFSPERRYNKLSSLCCPLYFARPRKPSEALAAKPAAANPADLRPAEVFAKT